MMKVDQKVGDKHVVVTRSGREKNRAVQPRQKTCEKDEGPCGRSEQGRAAGVNQCVERLSVANACMMLKKC